MINLSIKDYLLDNSLISQYNSKNNGLEIYDLKVIKCGDYLQFYNYSNMHSKITDDKKSLIKDNKNKSLLKLSNLDTDDLRESSSNELKNITLSNAIRSKLSCQRIAKCNIANWESFITLTFTDNVTDINAANKIFSQWSNNIRKRYKHDLMYLVVPEFQKRGAVHYHVLSNIGINDIGKSIISQSNFTDKQMAKMTNVQRSKCFNVRYWNYGFSRVDFLKGNIKKIIGYISKYMTEDIDNRLFNKRRYFYSQNLIKPQVEYLDLNNIDHIIYLRNLLENRKLNYKSTYLDKFNNSIDYNEYCIDRTLHNIYYRKLYYLLLELCEIEEYYSIFMF